QVMEKSIAPDRLHNIGGISEAHVNDLRAIGRVRISVRVSSPKNCTRHLPKLSLAVPVEHTDRHDLGVRCRESDDSGHVRPVPVRRILPENAYLARIAVV